MGMVNLRGTKIYHDMKKFLTLSLVLAAIFAFTPAYAQSSRGARGAAAAEEAAPKTGVRFVICSTGGSRLPSPLYYLAGKEYKSTSISGRIPTQRIKPVAGSIKFYDKAPNPPDAGKKGAKATPPADMPKPIMTIEVPAGGSGKTLCIVIPGETPAKAKTFFINEENFPSKGVHLINLSPRSVTIYTSAKGDFSDVSKKVVGPYRKEGINEKNSWNFTQATHGQQVAFRITTPAPAPKDGKKALVKETQLKVGKFVVSNRQSQINVVVKDDATNRLKLLSIQLNND